MKVDLTGEQLRTIKDALDNMVDKLPLYDVPEKILSWRLDRLMSAEKVIRDALRECAVMDYENR